MERKKSLGLCGLAFEKVGCVLKMVHALYCSTQHGRLESIFLSILSLE